MNVLLIEDDKKLVQILEKGLKEEGFILDSIDSIYLANEYLQIKKYDVIILDKILPDGDGSSLCLKMRENDNNTPLLMLSACNTSDDIVDGLNKGADDYLTKPFRFVELVARIRALSKRSNNLKSHILKVYDITLNIMSREVKKGEETIYLRNNEFNLLLLLMKRKNHVVPKTEIIDYIWNMENFIDPNLLNVTIYNLRKKIENPKDKKVIQTIRGIGYKIVE
ncbi:response regulator transcription factor [Sulfurimonas sediminis]|uniref:Response regulator transcription factor n=1 Tax=Sulfurimonas sediminis TaxID=2590020 RepID=A0A7M1B191_9BACT|nr:response regulator transcription factor [Sulfurimonas sediminis]QOP43400.1 response regulator transcription factor [Sulfurimonas sediminis]